MNPILADAIDIPYVLAFGLIVLIPLILFQVVLEGIVLSRMWHIYFRELCYFTLLANLWSLFAGIPVKLFNAWLYSYLLPDDLPGFFARYPAAVAWGAAIYFLVTLLVEGACAIWWVHQKNYVLGLDRIWKGIFLANLASYLVLAPLHYYFTRPMQQIREFRPIGKWLNRPAGKVLFSEASSGHLKSIQLADLSTETIVPMPVRDYLVSADLNLCLFRGTNGNLYLFRKETAQNKLIWQTHERFLMNNVAFSPSGRYVAFASNSSNRIEVVEVKTSQHAYQTLDTNLSFSCLSLGWSTNETQFYVNDSEKRNQSVFTIDPPNGIKVEKLAGTNAPPTLRCYGRVGSATWFGGEDWGVSFNHDTCGDLKIWTEPGLGSRLRVYQEGGARTSILSISVNPGLLHLARFYFSDAGWLEGCHQCLFEVNGYIYLLNIEEKCASTVAHGDRFILLTPRYQKQL